MYKQLIAFTAILGAVVAAPNPWGTTSSTWKPTTSSTWKASSTSVKASSTTSSAASPTSTLSNNGQIFVNKCVNFGISIADCTELLNIAALNGNTIVVGGSAPAGSTPVNNGQEFLNECANLGISVLDCAEVLNLAILNGNVIDISLSAVVSLLSALDLPQILTALLPAATGGLITLPSSILTL